MKTILIYDSKSYLYRFLKYRYRLTYNVVKSNKNLANNQIEYDALLFIVYNEKDVITFMDYYTQEKPILVCSDDLSYLDKYSNLARVQCVNTSISKKELEEKIFNTLNTII
ncbi:MAG TPA: hypothetical protein PLH25_02175 [Flavobacterium sp.]|nr:hypothetical protein [Flavobacterium sp.]HQW68446.1 hypothetical protein [Flavobacterium sp.]